MASGPTVIADTDVLSGGQTLDYAQEGYKVKRTFIVDGLTITPGTGDGSGTLWSATTATGIPARGTLHPYLNGSSGRPKLSADAIKTTMLSSTQAKVEVYYAVLNALTQEPSSAGDVAPALLSVACSLQTFQQIVDVNGEPLNVYYTTDNVIPSAAPKYTIRTPQGVNLDKTGTYAPNINCKAEVQQPNLVLRFQRREQAQRSPLGLVGYYNKNAWNVTQLTTGVSTNFLKHCLLCTRVENQTRDEGVSWIVTYEFAAANLVPNPNSDTFIFKSPAIAIDALNDAASGWDVGLYYVVPNGYNGTTGAGGSPANSPLAPGMIPSDALPTIFAVYGEYDFNGNLNLSA